NGIKGGDGLDTLVSDRQSDAMFVVDGAFSGTAAGVDDGFTEIENIASGDANDTIVVTNQSQIDIVSGGAGNDSFLIHGSAGSVIGESGDNYLLVYQGASLGSYEGGPQGDRVVVRGTFTRIATGDGNDTVTVATTGAEGVFGKG